jgi:Holliday junction resolvase RusA-like endonuclease
VVSCKRERGNSTFVDLISHIRYTCFRYNPSAKAQELFRNVVLEMMDTNLPVFEEKALLAMTIVFRLKRPLKDFVASRRGPGRLRLVAPSQVALTRTDVDNLAKFVLDSLNEVLYQDDRQIVSLHVTKLLDNQDDCLGSTQIHLRQLTEEHVSTLLNNTFSLY